MENELNYVSVDYIVDKKNSTLMDKILREYPYNSKIKSNDKIKYVDVLLKIDIPIDELEKNINKLYPKNILINEEPIIDEIIIKNSISINELGIGYFDGSHSSMNNKTSGCGILCEELTTKLIGKYEDFTKQYFTISTKTELVENGTNNIGELHGIKFILDQIQTKPKQSQKPYYLIIGDSEYVIKSFREWIYGWENNDWKSSTGKTIMNLELIKEIQTLLKMEGTTFLFKWVRGHNDNAMNELCDKMCVELTSTEISKFDDFNEIMKNVEKSI